MKAATEIPECTVYLVLIAITIQKPQKQILRGKVHVVMRAAPTVLW